MIEVCGSGAGLYFDGGHKGDFDIIFRKGWVFNENKHINGWNVDCSGEVFKAILKYAPFKEGIDKKRFLKNHEYFIKKALETQFNSPGNQRMCECYKCGVNQEGENIIVDEEDGTEYICCPPMNVDSDWSECYELTYQDYITPFECDNFILSVDAPIVSLKDFDLRSLYIYGLHMIGTIKSLKKPVVKHNMYYQDCQLWADDTNKIIECELNNNVADFDKWHNGDTVETWGIYKDGLYSITSMELIEVDTSEPVTVNRNSETPGYNEWRNTIVNRDKKCVCCGYDKHLEAHHLFGYKENPSLAVNESNGITLCKFCHDKYHSVYGLRDINPVDFVDFIKRFGVR